MRERMPGLAANLIATFFLFLLVILIRLLTGTDGTLMDLTVLAVVGTLVTLWLVWTLKIIDTPAIDSSSEKAKRSATDDSRLSLLLELLDDDERQAIKRRLLDELGGDGENISLAALLSAQDNKQSSSK